jgi:hypothetical protein
MHRAEFSKWGVKGTDIRTYVAAASHVDGNKTTQHTDAIKNLLYKNYENERGGNLGVS